MAPQFPDYRRVRRRIRRTLCYGAKQPENINLPLSELVVDFFNKRSPFDYMKPETSATISGRGYADPCTLVVAMVYLDRIRVKNKNWFESSDPTDLYLPSLVLASKFLHDSDTYDRASNAEWAEAANISSEHLNQLEWEFVQRLNWNVMVDQAEFDSWLRFFEYWVANDFLAKNGFCTYNELVQLSTTFPLASMLQALASFFGLMVFVYTFSVVSLFAIPCSRSFTDVSVVENSSMHPVSSVLVAVPDELRMLSTEVKPARSWTDLLQVGSTRKEASAFEDSNSSACELAFKLGTCVPCGLELLSESTHFSGLSRHYTDFSIYSLFSRVS